MPRSIRFFRNTCPHCNNDVGIPILGDFAYAEFVYQTQDGKAFAYSAAIDHPAWERIKIIFRDSARMALDRNNDEIRIYQTVMFRCADLCDGERYTTDFPLCSECGRKIDSYNDNEMLFDEAVRDATWSGFLSMSEAAQTAKVLALIQEVKPG